MAADRRTRYFGLHYKALRIFGLGMFHDPEEDNFDNYPTKSYRLYSTLSVIFNVIGYTSMELIFAYKAWKEDKDVELQFFSYTLAGVHFLAIFKMMSFLWYNKRFQRIIKVLEIDYKRFNGREKILERSITISNIITGFFFFMGEITIVCMCIYILKVDFNRKQYLNSVEDPIFKPRVTPFAAYVPWDITEDGPYFAAFAYCTFGMLWMGSALIILDTLLASIMIHISGQFKIIQDIIENVGDEALKGLMRRLPEIKSDDLKISFDDDASLKGFLERKRIMMAYFTNDEFNAEVECCLKNSVKYHQLIISITSELQESFSNGFMFHAMSSFYVIGLILVQAAQNVSNLYSLAFLNNLGFLISVLWQLFVLTFSANEVTLEAIKISDSAYSCCWHTLEWDCGKIRKLLGIVIHRAQQPIYLTAGKFAPMSNDLFVKIVRSAYQIFTLITTVMSPDK